MNPLKWKNEHHLAWIISLILGAIVGILFGFVISFAPLGAGMPAGTWLNAWLQNPDMYWPWPAFGAVISGLIFYLVPLGRS